jgi:hypothetical protein
MKVLKLAIVVAIAYGVWFQFIGNVYETGRWRLSEECGRIGSDRVRAMWVSAQAAIHDKGRQRSSTMGYAIDYHNNLYSNLTQADKKCLLWLLANSD